MDGIKVSEEKYGDHTLENVQIFESATKTDKPQTCMLFVHGGGWMCGKKEWYTEFMTPFLRHNPLYPANHTEKHQKIRE